MEDKKYLDNILKSEKIFNNFYKKKNVDERNKLKSFVYLNNQAVKKYLKSADSIYHWNVCVFESVTHEDYFVFYSENKTEVERLKEFGLKFI